VKRKLWLLLCLCLVTVLTSCAAGQSSKGVPAQPLTSDNLSIAQQPTPSPTIVIPRQLSTPAAKPNTSTYHTGPTPTNIPNSGTGSAPWGAPPRMTAEEIQLTQQLFTLMNSDRAARGLYAFVWNATLAGGARLHSWNMYHCGFSHTCPDGLDQCTRIANEGFAGYSDCGECIGLAGPSTPPWAHVYAVQESMINEPPGGWHRIHLTSATLHRAGVGIYVDPNGWVWFTEDLVS
jgi:uncharacterized protein YkwD